MPAARYWRLVAIEAHGGADLELSALHLYDAAGRADAAATIASSIAPTTGTLAALQDEDTASSCRFAAAAVRAPGFAITWDFGAGNTADVLAPRLAGPSRDTFLAGCTLQYSLDGQLWQWQAGFARWDWPGVGVLTNAPAVGDPHFDKVSLLLHFDGADGSTTFTDSSPRPKTVTAIGDAKISTAQGLFGGASGYFDGTGDALSVANSTELDFGTGDFTIECWVYIAGNSAPDQDGNRGCAIVSPWSAAVSGYIFGITGSTTTTGTGLQLDSWGDASGNGSLFRATASMPQNSWHHVAASVASGVRRLFLNGVQLSGAPITVGAGYASFDTFGRALQVGRSLSSVYPLPLNGYLKGLRITKGVARDTANFTPPAGPLPDASSGVGPVFLAPLLRAPAPDLARIAASSPVPPHSTMSAPRLLTARNVEFAGSGTTSATGTIYGSTAIKGTPNAPVRAKVSLLRARDLLLVQQTWSDPTTGAYAFHGLDPTVTYTTLAEYPTGDYRAVVADQLVPDIEEASAP